MRSILLLFFLTLTPFVFSEEDALSEKLILSTPDQIAALTSDSDYLIGGVVSPLSGMPVLRQTDLIARGAQDVVLHRTYLSPYMPVTFTQAKKHRKEWEKKALHEHLVHTYKGWQLLPHLYVEYYPRQGIVRAVEPSGLTLDFRRTQEGDFTLASPSYGMSNVLGETPSALHDLRNTRLVFSDEWKTLTLHAANGARRIYHAGANNKYLLQKEHLPNGKILRYTFNEGKSCMESLDPQQQHVYASIAFSGSSLNKSYATTSTEIAAEYSYSTRKFKWKTHQKISGKPIHAKVEKWTRPFIASISSPFYRQENMEYCDALLLTHYLAKDQTFHITHAGVGQPEHYRVHKLALPTGENEAFEDVYTISYELPIAGQKEGSTSVENSDGTKRIYHFSKDLLLKCIQDFDRDKILQKEKHYSWNNKQWLKSIEVHDANKTLLYRKTFACDSRGNPIVETFSGDLTGDGKQAHCTTRRQFSLENLLLQEENEEGKISSYTYLPKTHLITSKMIRDKERIRRRTFFLYDDCNNLIQEITDDGSTENVDDLTDVTQRQSIRYILRQSQPFLHMPEWSVETYLEQGVEKLLKKKHFLYDKYGNVTDEEIFSSEDMHAYTLTKIYNERADLLSETNPLGHRATYSYDAKARPATATTFSGRLQKTYQHDTKGRLRILTETAEEGASHTNTSTYDPFDRLLHKTDSFGNKIHYTYDLLTNQIIQTDFPPIATIDGKSLSVSTHATYDPFCRKVSEQDANGNTKTYKYNAYGAVTEIHGPEDSRESFRYTKSGRLEKHSDAKGLITHYFYDSLGRLLQKIYSTHDTFLAEESFTYDSFNLCSDKDKEGNVRQYSYDGAGRKIQEEFCGHLTTFSYNSLGQLTTCIEHNGENSLSTHYIRDREGRILQESKTDPRGTLLYKIAHTYDPDGRQSTITRHIQGKEAIQTFLYDAFGRLIQERDAEDNTTTTHYEEDQENALGQRVLCITITSPLGIKNSETKDALSRTVKREKASLNPLAAEEMFYDPQGNLLYRKDHVYEKGALQSSQILHYTYTPCHHIASCIKGFNDQSERTTTYTYFSSGHIATKTLPSGITLSYAYDPFGHLSHLCSSDGTIDHTFTYNLLGHLTSTTDENQKATIVREIDSFGNILSENFPCGLEIKKSYDLLNRPTTLHLPQGDVHYTYNPLHLSQVTYHSSQNTYTHSYTYDLAGYPLQENTPIGPIQHTKDLRGLTTALHSPHFSQECCYDALGNLIENSEKTKTHYPYDDLSQLTAENTLTYSYDSLYNRKQKNDEPYQVNPLNELLSTGNDTYTYDLDGNRILKKTPSETWQYHYDPLGRLIAASSTTQRVQFSYDPLGRCIKKTHIDKTIVKAQEYYLYDGQNEMGAYLPNLRPLNFRVLGQGHQTIGIEIAGHYFTALLDVQGNIRRLLDQKTTRPTHHYDFTAFGEPLKVETPPALYNPWSYASKRLHAELGLIDFGRRYYDPLLGRWLTTDPAGFIDSVNLYQYVFNNPFRYRDPNGKFIIMLPLVALAWKVVAAAAITLFLGYEIQQYQERHLDSEFARSFNTAVHQALQSSGGLAQYALNEYISKNVDVYAPDRPLPRDPRTKEPVPETDAPHTELSSKEGTKGKYPQAREFDIQGKPVKDIDFTDHGHPQTHPIPHEHKWKPNKTGGTPNRSREAEPLTGWEYK